MRMQLSLAPYLGSLLLVRIKSSYVPHKMERVRKEKKRRKRKWRGRKVRKETVWIYAMS